MHLAAVIVLVAVGISLAVLASTRPSSSGAGAPDEATAIETLPYRDDAVDAPAFDAVAQELTASCTSPSHASWYVFTPVADTPLTAWVIPDRDGSTVLDVALVVWSLTADGSLVEAGCVDDRGAGGAEQLVLTAAGEGTYYVQAAAVDHEGSVGTLTLLADVQRPEHDLFAFARRMETTPYRDEGVDAIGARREPGETIPSCVDLEATTWYRISAPQDLVFSATVDPAPAADNVLDAAMALYAGDTVDALLEVACADSAGVRGKEHLEVPILGGEEYWLQIGAIVGEDSGPGVYTLSVDGLQAIELRPVPDTFLGAAPLMVDAEVTSGLPVTLAVEGPCRISDGALVAEGAGLCTITASQEGDSTWAPAVPVTTTLRVSRGRQAIELEPLDRAVVGVPLSVQATADSGLPVVFETSGSCRVAQGTLLADGSGTCTITASQPGDADWAPAEPVTTSVLVGRGQQEIELDLPRATRTGAVPLELVATTSSGLPVALEADGPCRLGDDGLVATGAGACTITATQDGDVDWAPAEPVTTTLRIGRGRQSIELEPIDERLLGDGPVELQAASSSGLPVTYSAEGPCDVKDGILKLRDAGRCTVTASQPGGGDWEPADASTSFRIVGPITDRRQDMTGNVAMSPPGTLLGDGAQITAGFEPDGPQTHYYAIALDESEVLEIAVSQPGTAWSIAEPTALTTGETTWQDIEIDPETSVARWVANESGIHSIRVTGDGPGPDDGSTYTMQVRVDPDSRDEAESALLDSVRSFKCKLLTNRDREAFVAGALAGVRCLRPRPDVYELQLYTFPDGQRLRALHRARVDEVSPELVATADACRLGQRGVTTWAHGRVACWTPDGQMRAVLHWTDLRTNTYGILRTDVEANRRRFARWRALRETIA